MWRPDDFLRFGNLCSFGEVFKGTCFGQDVAIKTILNVTESSARGFREEILLTSILRHPNIVSAMYVEMLRRRSIHFSSWSNRSTSLEHAGVASSHAWYLSGFQKDPLGICSLILMSNWHGRTLS
jgi:serine/threonine protein kinase